MSPAVPSTHASTVDRYAVFGHPIAHSKSPDIHARFARATGQHIDYTRIEAPPQGFEPALRAFVASGARGANVTLPFKVEAATLADVRSTRVAEAGAANALRFSTQGRIEAENFDGVGLVTDLQSNLGITLAGRRVLVLGAGGAARGAVGPLLDAKPTAVCVANRTLAKAQALVDAFAARADARALSACGLDALTAAPFDVVVNATSTGLDGTPLALPQGLYAPGALAYDMVYGQGLTPFLRHARDAGVTQLADGLGMLVEQAAEAFAWWRGVRPATAAVIDAMRVPLR